jgi:hypothetical protein
MSLLVINITAFHIHYQNLANEITAWGVLGLRMEERSPAMKGSCEYIEQLNNVCSIGRFERRGGD